MLMSTDERATSWAPVCPVDRMIPNRGVAALVDGRAVAVFLLAGGELHAIDNIDPISGASVMSRGLVGDADGIATVASPMYKQRFDLRTGRCLDDPDATVTLHSVQIVDGIVHVKLTP